MGDEGAEGRDYRAVGVFGLSIYCLLVLLSLGGAIRARYVYSRVFYCFTLAYCVLELPRCASLATQAAITGRYEYASHIVANCCFSASLSTVCYIWHDITRVTVGAAFDPKHLLVGVNMGLLVISIIAAAVCIAADSLVEFSTSPAFALYVFIDAFVSFALAVSVLVFGIRLLQRLQALEASSKLSSPVRRIAARLILIMAICSLAFVMRCVTVLMKVIMDGPRQHNIGFYFTPFGAWWWALADMLPRLLATIMFIAFLSGRTEVGTAQMLESLQEERESELGEIKDSITSKSTFSKGPQSSFHSSRQDYELRESGSSHLFSNEEYVSKHSDGRLLSATTYSSDGGFLRSARTSSEIANFA